MDKSISRKIIKAREALGQNRIEFAKAVNAHTKRGRKITPQALREWEVNFREPGATIMPKIQAYIDFAIPEKIKELKKV